MLFRSGILLQLLSGGEVLTPEKDYTWNIELDDYYRKFSRAIGKTSPNVKTVYLNKKYVYNMDSKDLGSLNTHEYGHKVGFHHDFRATAARPNSLCYLLNKAYDEAWEALLGDKSKRDKKRLCKRLWYTLWIKKVCFWGYEE